MSKQDLICPECNTIIGFKNVIAFEPEEMSIEAIAYFITCKKCDTTFVSPMRYSTKASAEQEEIVKEMFEGFLKSKESEEE